MSTHAKDLRALEKALNSSQDPLTVLAQRHASSGLFEKDNRAYRLGAEHLLRRGLPVQAFELTREALEVHGEDRQPELLHLRALALARAGNDRKAEEYAAALLRRRHVPESTVQEALALRGRIEKDRYARETDAKVRRGHARASARYYTRAFEESGRKNTYPGINAALMTLLGGIPARSHQLAQDVVRLCRNELRRRSRKKDPWLLATLAEGQLLLRDEEAARDSYTRALKIAGSELGTIGAMRRDVVLLHEVRPVSQELLDIFDLGRVAAFSGHMLDPPGVRPGGPRIPDHPKLTEALGDAIATRLEELDVRVGVSSAACGSDILFAERLLDRGGELHLIIPYDLEDFFFTSVDMGLPSRKGWRQRVEHLLDTATEVHWATHERCLADPCVLDFTNGVIQGLAALRAEHLGVDTMALVVCEGGGKAAKTGGAAHFLKRWQRGSRHVEVIDPAPIREQVRVKSRASRGKPRTRELPGVDRIRMIRGLLFADVKGFSKLTEEQSPSFFVDFLDELAGLVRHSPDRPQFSNTWGDGLFMVFEEPTSAAEFALQLLEMVESVDWDIRGLPTDTTVRIGLHAGPVFPHLDPVTERPNFFGGHVNRAARIEPVTVPGCRASTRPRCTAWPGASPVSPRPGGGGGPAGRPRAASRGRRGAWPRPAPSPSQSGPGGAGAGSSRAAPPRRAAPRREGRAPPPLRRRARRSRSARGAANASAGCHRRPPPGTRTRRAPRPPGRPRGGRAGAR
jgi:class 3 adenylate cyclase